MTADAHAGLVWAAVSSVKDDPYLLRRIRDYADTEAGRTPEPADAYVLILAATGGDGDGAAMVLDQVRPKEMVAMLIGTIHVLGIVAHGSREAWMAALASAASTDGFVWEQNQDRPREGDD